MTAHGLSRALDRFKTQAQVVLGDNLVSLVVFGETIADGGAALGGPVEAMIVLREIDVVTLNQLRRVVLDARRELELAPLVLTPNDLERSTDVFPVKFQTMKWRHRRLCGEDLLSALEIDREHLRLRAEQEIKNLLFRLRRFYIERSHRGELLEVTLARGVESLLRNLAVLLYLKTGEALDAEATAARAAADLGIPAKPLTGALALGSDAAQEDLPALYDDFMAAVERAADLVDRYKEER